MKISDHRGAIYTTWASPSIGREDSKGSGGDMSTVQDRGSGKDPDRTGRVIIRPNRSELALAAAGMIAAVSLVSIQQRGAFNVALAGGSTPGPVYELLAAGSDIDWQRTRIYWSDERCVPPEHAESNYRMVRETLLDRLPQEPGLVARLSSELSPEEAAQAYEQTIRETVPAEENGIPRFDMILLGMGDDGHTASLFPRSKALNEAHRLVVADYVSKFDAFRLTFTYPLLNAGRHVLILVSGSSKASTLSAVLNGPMQPDEFPVQAVQPTRGQFRWLVDADAAKHIR